MFFPNRGPLGHVCVIQWGHLGPHQDANGVSPDIAADRTTYVAPSTTAAPTAGPPALTSSVAPEAGSSPASGRSCRCGLPVSHSVAYHVPETLDPSAEDRVRRAVARGRA